MRNKALRIMIADPEHFQRMQLERLFNHRGYFRIAPVSNVQEFLALVDYGGEPFDLIIANASLPEGALDLPGFFLDNRQVRHAMIYNAQQTARRSHVQTITARLPDAVTLQRLMAEIDPAAFEPAQPWGRIAKQGRGI